MYLLDTDVLSELRKRKRDANVVAWIGAVAPADLYLSTVTIAEIEQGIERRRRDDPTFAGDLAHWLDTTLRLYGERVLPLTIGIARRWGRLAAQVGNRNLDLAIAATALEHGLTVVTRNVAHYAPTGVGVVNPFEGMRRTRR
jgi:predicted nucleic acid-binding protein